MADVIAEDGGCRLHRKKLLHLLESNEGPVRIASAYVTDRGLLLRKHGREIRLIAPLLPMDIASGATSLDALAALIEAGVKCRFPSDIARFHAKVYVFGSEAAVVSSANLTRNAFDSNIEVGVEIREKSCVRALIMWYDEVWATSKPLDLPLLADLRRKVAALRREYVTLRNKSDAMLSVLRAKPAHNASSDDVVRLFEKAKQFFVCNTDRRHRERSALGAYLLEEMMHNRGYAAAWESFKFPGHMEQVQAGNAILMFAKGVGIVGIGQATAPCEKLEPGDPLRLYNDRYLREVEWRVPVRWLDWRDQEDAFPWKSQNFTFWNVSEEAYSDLREGVKEHFLRQ